MKRAGCETNILYQFPPPSCMSVNLLTCGHKGDSGNSDLVAPVPTCVPLFHQPLPAPAPCCADTPYGHQGAACPRHHCRGGYQGLQGCSPPGASGPGRRGLQGDRVRLQVLCAEPHRGSPSAHGALRTGQRLLACVTHGDSSSSLRGSLAPWGLSHGPGLEQTPRCLCTVPPPPISVPQCPSLMSWQKLFPQ